MTSQRMSPSELAAWMQQERQTLARLTAVLKEHLARVPAADAADWLGSLRVAFDRLWRHVQRSSEAQELGGYLEQVRAQRPAVAGELERCRREHDELLALAGRIRRELAGAGPQDGLLLTELAESVGGYLKLVADHDRRENALAQLAFNLDIGDGD